MITAASKFPISEAREPISKFDEMLSCTRLLRLHRAEGIRELNLLFPMHSGIGPEIRLLLSIVMGKSRVYV